MAGQTWQPLLVALLALPDLLPPLPLLHPSPPQLSSHQGSLSALRRQLAAAQDEQGKLAQQLRTGLATAGEAPPAGDEQLGAEASGAGWAGVGRCWLSSVLFRHWPGTAYI